MISLNLGTLQYSKKATIMISHSPKELAILVVSHRKEIGLSQAEVADRVGLHKKPFQLLKINQKVQNYPLYFKFCLR